MYLKSHHCNIPPSLSSLLDLNKKCQDCYSVTENFAERDTDGFFGVYDGHGGDGAECANFVAETLPTLLAVVMNKSREIELKV